jgi:ribosomal protein S18 acetylase RimI-like enzyme
MTESATDVGVLTTGEFAVLVTTAAQIYGEAMHRPPELVVQRREIMASHLSRQGLVAVGAQDKEQLVGFGYGYRGRPGEWWHDIVADALGRSLAKRWLTDSFELAELHVHPDKQGTGIGRQILELLLDNVDGRAVVLSTHDRESPARALYRSVGFEDLLTGFVFPGSNEVYVLMGKPL